ncbi:MAG: L,D-transpeptidase family protein [Bdellovibrionota bacterium]
MPIAQKNLAQLMLFTALLASSPAQAGFFDDLFSGHPHAPWDNGPTRPPMPEQPPEPAPVVMGKPKPVIVGPFSNVAAAANLTDTLRLSLAGPGSITVGKQFVVKDIAQRIYGLRGFQPIFVNESGATSLGLTMRKILVETSLNKGFASAFYWSAEADARMALKDIKSLAELDLLLTINFLQYANDSANGRINPQDPSQNLMDIEYPKRSLSDYAALNAMLVSPEALEAGLNSLEPKHPIYQRMVTAMTRLRATKKAGGWPKLVSDRITKPGTAGKNIAAVRARLFDLGLLPDSADRDPSPVYDATLQQAVKYFQEGAKMRADGQLGSETLNALDASIDSRIRQLQANLERWRLMPKDLGTNYVFVDMGRQYLHLVQEGAETLAFRTVVGMTVRQTPSFPDEIGHVLVNPYWFAPGTIVVKDILPQVMQNPEFFHMMNMKVFDNDREMDTSRLDPEFWAQYSLQNLPPFTFREDPGPNNSLGRVKFQLLKNKHDIYMHDTNHHELFANNLRLNSSGCIRLELPVDLAEALLKSQGITKANIDAMIADPTVVAKKIVLTQKMQVYVMGTTIAMENGSLMYGPDIYGQDRKILDALNGLRIIPTALTMDFFGDRDSTL